MHNNAFTAVNMVKNADKSSSKNGMEVFVEFRVVLGKAHCHTVKKSKIGNSICVVTSFIFCLNLILNNLFFFIFR